MDHWFAKVDDIDNGLAADFNGSLSGLGVESVSDTYDMSEALLALPAVFKDEEESLMKMALMHSSGSHMAPFLSLADVSLLDSDSNIYICPSPVDSLTSNSLTPIIINDRTDFNNSEWQKLIKSMKLTEISDDASSLVIDLISENIPPTITHKFQYVLKAPTSPSAKLSDETLTYLNQGQLYELNLKRLTESSDLIQHSLKSLISLKLEDKKLMTEEQMFHWQKTHPKERLIDFDSKLSKGFSEIKISDTNVNRLEAIWDLSKLKHATLWLKINCISTEFTVKKLGGEKGIPFRLSVETSSIGSSDQMLHKASCLIKVFKMRGADRKNKTDREKLEKSTQKKRYQPYFECTVLTEMPFENSDIIESFSEPQSEFNQMLLANNHTINQPTFCNISSNNSNLALTYLSEKNAFTQTSISNGSQSSSRKRHSESCLCISSPAKNISSPQEDLLNSVSSPDEVITWLERNRFKKYTETFQNFSGSDLLRLTKDDLIQICGLADGIRLYNSLQARLVQPRLTIFVCQRKSEINATHSPVTSSLSSSPSQSPTPISDAVPPKQTLISPTALHANQTCTANGKCGEEISEFCDNGVSKNELKNVNYMDLNILSSSASNNALNDVATETNIDSNFLVKNTSCINRTNYINQSFMSGHVGECTASNNAAIIYNNLLSATSNPTVEYSDSIPSTGIDTPHGNNKEINNIPDIMDHHKKVIVLSDAVSSRTCVSFFIEPNKPGRNCANNETADINNLNDGTQPVFICNKSMPDLLSDDSGFIELKLTDKDNGNNFATKSHNFKDPKIVDINPFDNNAINQSSFVTVNSSIKYPFLSNINTSLTSNNLPVSQNFNVLTASYKEPVTENSSTKYSILSNNSGITSTDFLALQNFPISQNFNVSTTNYKEPVVCSINNSVVCHPRRWAPRKSSCGSSCKRPIRDGRVDDSINELTIATSKKQKIHHLQSSPTLPDVYHAVYMDNLSERQLARKLGDLLKLDECQIVEILLHSTLGIHVLVTDLVVQNVPNQSHYEVEVDEVEEQSGNYRIILKSVQQS